MRGDERSLLIADDDAAWCEAVAGALRRRGFNVTVATDAARATQTLRENAPCYALIDLRIGDDSGLALIAEASRSNPPVRTVVLTGYASIATAVEAIKLGATEYLAKPATVNEILDAFSRDEDGDASAPPAADPPSIRRLEWEHIQRVLRTHGGNISATARALNMHRRTLQRKLYKHPVRH